MTTKPFEAERGATVVADDPAAAAAGLEAVKQVGARILATVPWTDACDAIVAQVTPPTLLMIETAGVAADVVERLLPDLVETVDMARIVVAFPADHLEQVGAVLIGSGAALLCEPTHVDRVAALTMALHARPRAAGESSEDEARLAQINAEVARFTETLARLTGTAGPDAGA